MDFLEEVKESLRPDVSVLKKADKLISEINKKMKSMKIKAVCVEGGSVAKGTFLKDDFDIDLFVRFDSTYKGKDISGILSNILDGYNAERLHGSRDYFHVKKDSLNFEIVPVLDVMDPALAENVTDMSPMHVDWVKKRLKKGWEDEIRLAKKFCKAAGVYGAESYIRGFSGHVIDILIIHYSGFMNLLRGSQKWKAPFVIDTEKHYKNRMDILFSMNRSKIEGPMILVDPILKTRNAASALSYEKFSQFKKKAALFLKKPDRKFFEEHEIGKPYLRKKFGRGLYLVSLGTKEGKKDVVGSSVLKGFTLMEAELKNMGFRIKASGWHWNSKRNALFWFSFKEDILPEKKIIEGPPAEMKSHAADFRKKYRACYVKGKRYFAEVKNKLRQPEDAIRHVAEKDFIKSRLELKEIEKYK